MRNLWLMLGSMALLSLATEAQGKARFASKAEMISEAQVIAVVEITGVENTSTKGGHWTYGQKATARVERVLKGKLPATMDLHGLEDFICAQCKFEPGRAVVFLRRDSDLWVGSNWQISVRPIRGGQVDWPRDANVFESDPRPLDAVVKEIEATLAQPPARP